MTTHVIHLLLRAEVEVSDDTPETVAAVVDDIDSQISGSNREIRVPHPDGGKHYVDYQVTAFHGERKNPA
jgi:hypothetical protein